MPPYRPKASIEEINKALFIIKSAVANGNFKFLDSRRKNMNTLAELGLVTQNVLDLIFEITYKNYLNGPTDDRDRKRDTKCIWEFGYNMDDNPIYIKIKILDINNVIGISFHIAERQLNYFF